MSGGYDLHMFLDKVEPRLLCKLCRKVMRDAMVIPSCVMGHGFCRSCLDDQKRNPEDFQCVSCSRSVSSLADSAYATISRRPDSQESPPVEDKINRNKINHLRVKCPYNCDAQGLRLANLEAHEPVCPNRPSPGQHGFTSTQAPTKRNEDMIIKNFSEAKVNKDNDLINNDKDWETFENNIEINEFSTEVTGKKSEPATSRAKENDLTAHLKKEKRRVDDQQVMLEAQDRRQVDQQQEISSLAAAREVYGTELESHEHRILANQDALGRQQKQLEGARGKVRYHEEAIQDIRQSLSRHELVHDVLRDANSATRKEVGAVSREHQKYKKDQNVVTKEILKDLGTQQETSKQMQEVLKQQTEDQQKTNEGTREGFQQLQAAFTEQTADQQKTNEETRGEFQKIQTNFRQQTEDQQTKNEITLEGFQHMRATFTQQTAINTLQQQENKDTPEALRQQQTQNAMFQLMLTQAENMNQAGANRRPPQEYPPIQGRLVQPIAATEEPNQDVDLDEEGDDFDDDDDAYPVGVGYTPDEI